MTQPANDSSPGSRAPLPLTSWKGAPVTLPDWLPKSKPLTVWLLFTVTLKTPPRWCRLCPAGPQDLPEHVRAWPEVAQDVVGRAVRGGPRLAGVQRAVVVEVVVDGPAEQARLARVAVAVAVDVLEQHPRDA